MTSNFKFKISNSDSRGFSLIELVVVLAVFILIVGSVVTIFVSMVKEQKGVLREQQLLNQESYAIEYMARSIRLAKKDSTGACLGQSYVGYDYVLGHYDTASGFYQGITFVDNDGLCHGFFLDTTGALKENKGTGSSQDILSGNFILRYARFIANGDKSLGAVGKNDLVQPRISFALKIETQNNGQVKGQVLQTTISKRELNLPS